MAFLLQARFNSLGPTNSDIIKIEAKATGVNFSHPSRLYNAYRTCYFEPADDTAGLKVIGGSYDNIKKHVRSPDAIYCIYFKYKIDLRNKVDCPSVPILTWICANTSHGFEKWIEIEDCRRFKFCISGVNNQGNQYANTIDCPWAFDDNWHTCLINKTARAIELFIDGYSMGSSYISLSHTNHFQYMTNLYIGRSNAKSDYLSKQNHYITIPGGEIDDFCIVDQIVYTKNFIPPTQYWKGIDSISNYYMKQQSDSMYMPKDLADMTPLQILHTVESLDSVQLDWLPRRLRIQWHEEDALFDDQNFYAMHQSGIFTAFSINGLHQQLIMEPDTERFINVIHAIAGVQDGLLYPFMLFVDHKYIKLSDVYISKSDQYFTIFVNGRRCDKYDSPCQSLELVLIPFKCYYEENQPIREEVPVLYAFDEEGKFDKNANSAVYYIDPVNSADIQQTDILEEYVSPGYLDDESIEDKQILDSKWRHGTFVLQNADNSVFTMSFVSSNNEFKAEVGDKVLLYKNGTTIEGYDYEVVGDDLIRFSFETGDYKELIGKAITMQLIKSSYQEGEIAEIYEGLTELKSMTIRVDQYSQNQFTIPAITDDYGYEYEQFLVFRDGVCLNGKNRYTMSYQNGERKLTLNYGMDATCKNKPITLFFFHSYNSTDAETVALNPVYLYTRTGRDEVEISEHNTVSTIKIPQYRKLEYTKNNVFFFVNGLLIDSNRYDIEDGYVIMKDNLDNLYHGDPGFAVGKEVIFVILRLTMSNPLDETTLIRTQIIQQQWLEGARFILRDLNINKKVKITMNNLTIFDNQGRYMPEVIGEVYSMNIIKSIKSAIDPQDRVPRYVTCVYSKSRSLENTSNVTIPDNDDYVKSYIRLYQEFYELEYDFDLLMHDYKFTYNSSDLYPNRLSRAYYSSLQYNQWNYLNLYKKRCNVQRMAHDTKVFNQKITNPSADRRIYFDRGLYKGDSTYKTYVMYFENGKIPEWYGTIEYSMNYYSFEIDETLEKDTELELFKFHNMNNTLILLSSTIS